MKKLIETGEVTVSEPAKKRGRPKKETTPEAVALNVETTDVVVTDSATKSTTKKKVTKIPTAGWSNQRINLSENGIIKESIKVEVMLLRSALGMTPSDPDALKFIQNEETKEDENNPYGEAGANERAATIWPKAQFIPIDGDRWQLVNEFNLPTSDNATELPFIYDYQLRGMFKDSCGLLSRAKNNESSDLKAYKKWIDGNIFIGPRKIAFTLPEFYQDDNGVQMSTYDENGKLRTLARPLRTSGPSGERSAIAISEIVPPGSTFKFEIQITSPNLRPVIYEWLDYGMYHGLGQWRNSGIGIFAWRELDENWNPIVTE